MNGKRIKWTSGIASIWMLLVLYSFSGPVENNMDPVRKLYSTHLAALITRLNKLKADVPDGNKIILQNDFNQCRREYKHVEYLVAYQYPLVAQRMNGPAVLEMEPADINEVSLPTGFQVLEEYIFEENTNADAAEEINKQIDHLTMYAGKLRQQSSGIPLTASKVYDAIRFNLYNLAAKGISGFDAPVSQQSLPEAVVTIQSAQEVLQALAQTNAATDAAAQNCIRLLTKKGISFNQFDRAEFLTKGLIPYLLQLYQLQLSRQVAFEKRRSAVKTDAISFFAPNAFNAFYFSPDTNATKDVAITALGKQLFYATALSTAGRSCGSCHNPAKAYTDGLTVNQSLQRNEGLLRNTPSLTYACLQPVLFYDTRAQYLEDQARDVIHNNAEMAGDLQQTIPALQADTQINTAFKNAFPADANPINEKNILLAITCFERSLPSFNSPFDQYMQGRKDAMTTSQIAGYNLFMGKAKCGTCHYTPLFNGTVPPFYEKTDTEIIGVPGSADIYNTTPDKDPGVYSAFKNNVKKGAFKTPTLRNIGLTAPYMHNGIYKTLEEVITFYNKGGGRGLGLSTPNQTLDDAPLELTPKEQQQLIAFLNALTDN